MAGVRESAHSAEKISERRQTRLHAVSARHTHKADREDPAGIKRKQWHRQLPRDVEGYGELLISARPGASTHQLILT